MSLFFTSTIGAGAFNHGADVSFAIVLVVLNRKNHFCHMVYPVHQGVSRVNDLYLMSLLVLSATQGAGNPVLQDAAAVFNPLPSTHCSHYHSISDTQLI